MLQYLFSKYLQDNYDIDKNEERLLNMIFYDTLHLNVIIIHCLLVLFSFN